MHTTRQKRRLQNKQLLHRSNRKTHPENKRPLVTRSYLVGAKGGDVWTVKVGTACIDAIDHLCTKLPVFILDHGFLAQTKNSALTSTASTRCTQRDEASPTVANKRDVPLQSQFTSEKLATVLATLAHLDGVGRVNVSASGIGRTFERRRRVIDVLFAKLAVVG